MSFIDAINKADCLMVNNLHLTENRYFNPDASDDDFESMVKIVIQDSELTYEWSFSGQECMEAEWNDKKEAWVVGDKKTLIKAFKLTQIKP